MLIISSLEAFLDDLVSSPFATLLPAYNMPERQQLQTLVKRLTDLGCVEFCCTGPEAELLHDALDEIIELDDAVEVVTTWVVDLKEASEYFLHAAAGGGTNLLALVLLHADLEAVLEEEARPQIKAIVQMPGVRTER